MKKSINTFLKHAGQDKINKSANPAIVRINGIFKSIQELRKHQKKLKLTKKLPFGIMVDKALKQLSNYKKF